MRSRVSVPFLALGVLLLGLVAGCGGGDKPAPASGPGLPSQAALKSYFAAITGSDADELARVQSDITADGSPAQGFAAYIAAFSVAAAAGGETADPVEVKEVDGGFKACVGDDSDHCATWTDLQGKDGKLADFTINGTSLDDLFVDLTAQPVIESAGLYRVEPGWAYLQPKSGLLYVVVTVTAHDAALTPKPGLYIEGDQILKGIEGPSPTTIPAGTSSPVVLAFPGAKGLKLDGQVTFDLGIEGAGTESIGFGLADPAAP